MTEMLTPVMLPVRATQIRCANKCRIRPINKGSFKDFNGLHLPYDVVSKPEHVYGLVQTGNTCAYSHGGKVVIFLAA